MSILQSLDTDIAIKRNCRISKTNHPVGAPIDAGSMIIVTVEDDFTEASNAASVDWMAIGT